MQVENLNSFYSVNDDVALTMYLSKLRLKYYPDRTPKGESSILIIVQEEDPLNSVLLILKLNILGGPYPPEADFANHWNGFVEVNHM